MKFTVVDLGELSPNQLQNWINFQNPRQCALYALKKNSPIYWDEFLKGFGPLSNAGYMGASSLLLGLWGLGFFLWGLLTFPFYLISFCAKMLTQVFIWLFAEVTIKGMCYYLLKSDGKYEPYKDYFKEYPLSYHPPEELT